MSNEYKDYYKGIERTNDDISSCLEYGDAIVSLEELAQAASREALTNR